MNKLAAYLNRHIVGNVFERSSITETYADDRSILHATPALVAFPETIDDLCVISRFTNQLANRGVRLPITVRGTGLDKTGAAIGDGIVVSTERMCHLEEIDVRGRLVRVQPGMTLGALNSALSIHGLCLPIDYHPRATIGGLIANCTNDDSADRYGGIYHYVERAEVVLADGELVQFAPYSLRSLSGKDQSVEVGLYKRVEEVLDKHADTVVDRSMRPFDTAGYANVTRVRQGHTMDLLPLLFASQGTLGIIADVILRVEPLPNTRRQLLAILPDMQSLLRVANFVHELEPCALKLYDMRIVEAATQYGNRPNFLPRENAEGWLLQVSFDYRKGKATRKLRQCLEVLPVGTFVIENTPDNSEAFSKLNSTLLSYLNDNPDGECLAILDDVYLPNYRLGELLEGLKLIEEALGVELTLYGSYATANYHVRPRINYTTLAGRKLALKFLNQYSRLVTDLGGSITGGSPEGKIKALATASALPDAEWELYNDIKNVFDPNNILNPEVKLGAEFRKTLRHLRTRPLQKIVTP